MRKKFIFLTLFFQIFILNKTLYAENNIYFIDIKYIFSNSIAGKKVNNQLEINSNEIKKEFSNYQKIIKDEGEKLNGQKKILSKEDFLSKKQELDKKIRDYNKIISKKEQDYTKFKNDSYNHFLKELLIVVNDYAQKNSIQLILKKENIILGKNNLDISSNVLSLFNNKIKDIKIK